MNREQEVLNLIKQNPFISQDEIADVLNIKRGTVGVHILNLQKKGLILGRGYILNEDAYVLGIGSANVDIYGKSFNEIRPHYDHPSKVMTNVGGVTRNILENLANLGVKTKLVTAIGDDIFGSIIVNECQRAGIDVNNILKVEAASSGVFMQVLDDNNDMHLAMTDFDIMQKMNKEFIQSKSKLISSAKCIVCDPSMPIESLIELTETNIPVFVDPTSEALALKIKDIVGRFYFLKPNLSELAVIADMEIETSRDVKIACKKLIEKGLKRICVSLGSKGCVYMDSEGNYIERSLSPVDKMVNASGAGDAFMATLIYCYVNGLDNIRMLDYSMAAGIAAIMCESTINKDLSIALIDKIIKERKR